MDELSWYELARRALFRMDAEKAHHRVMGLLSKSLKSERAYGALKDRLAVVDERLTQELWGLTFANPVGLAAGFDKDGEHLRELSALGFGHIEAGTVTGQPQEGNPKPRLFRLPDDQALVNRMGFNNRGSEALAARLEGVEVPGVVGVNIGKSKVVPLEEAVEDYALSLRRVRAVADYLVVNVSSPNTPGLRSLQGREHLEELLGALSEINGELEEVQGRRVPMLVKISPDLTAGAMADVIDVVMGQGLDGIIATNTTIRREGLRSLAVPEPGGVSGRPLTERSRQAVAFLYRETGGAVPIIGVGGIFDGEDAAAMMRAGASLVQIWTGFVYGGPATVKKVLQEMQAHLDRDGVGGVAELVGEDAGRIGEEELR